jgi:hypothetical protein
MRELPIGRKGDMEVPEKISRVMAALEMRSSSDAWLENVHFYIDFNRLLVPVKIPAGTALAGAIKLLIVGHYLGRQLKRAGPLRARLDAGGGVPSLCFLNQFFNGEVLSRTIKSGVRSNC